MFPPIKSFIDDYEYLRNYLIQGQEISMVSLVDDHFKKIYLLSCASYYEQELQTIIRDFISNNSNDERVLSFVVNKAIERQYHTYFNWESKNINSFLGLFGSDFKKKTSTEIEKSEELTTQMRAFLSIGQERNKMVHENFLIYQLNKTFDEINTLNKKAIDFLEYLKKF